MNQHKIRSPSRALGDDHASNAGVGGTGVGKVQELDIAPFEPETLGPKVDKCRWPGVLEVHEVTESVALAEDVHSMGSSRIRIRAAESETVEVVGVRVVFAIVFAGLKPAAVSVAFFVIAVVWL